MSTLKKGVVIDVPAWKIPVISRKKLLKQPEIEVSVKFAPDEVAEMPDKQFKVFEASFEKGFTPAYQKMSEGWFSDIQKQMDIAEDNIEKVGKGVKDEASGKKLLEAVVAKVNADLVAKAKAWTVKVQDIAQKAYEAAVAASLKAMQLKVTKAKAKMVAKVVFFVLLTLTAAAVTIAVSVVTMGAGAAIAPVVLAGIVVAGKALFGSVGEVIKNYDVMATTIAAVEADTKKISAAVTAYSKAAQKTAGKIDKAKVFAAALTTSVDSLDKHVGQLDKFVAVARAGNLKRVAELQELANKLATVGDKSPEAAKLNKQALSLQRDFDDAREGLKAMDDVKKVAAEARAAFVKIDPEGLLKAVGKIAPAVEKISKVVAVIQKAAPALKEIFNGVTKIAKAAAK
jgi:hypothetical protein